MRAVVFVVVASGVVAAGCPQEQTFACAEDDDCISGECIAATCVERDGQGGEGEGDVGEGEGEGEAPGPPGVDDAVTVDEDDSVELLLAATGASSDALFLVVEAPALGSVTLDGARATYTPAPDANGADRFTFLAVDDGRAGAPGTIDVTITPVNDPPRVSFPTARAGVVRIYTGTAVDIPVAIDHPDGAAAGGALVFANASLGALSIAAATPPASIRYDASAGREGADTLTAVVQDADGERATVSVTVVVEPPQIDCFRVFARGLSVGSGVYTLIERDDIFSARRYRAWCQMDAVGALSDDEAAGFTLVLRSADGSFDIFNYDDGHWFVDTPFFDAEDRASLDDDADSWLRSWHSSPAREVLLLLKGGDGAFRALAVNRGVTFRSLFDLVDLTPDNTPAVGELPPREQWLALVDGATLQPSCNLIGFNLDGTSGAKLRFGIIGNEQDDCSTPDSYVGFGANLNGATDVTAGNRDNNDRRNVRAAALVRSKDLSDLGDRPSCDAWRAEGFEHLDGVVLSVAGALTTCAP